MAAIMLLGLIGLGATAARCEDESAVKAGPPIIVRFMLDRPIDGAMAPFVVASTRGFFRSANLDVTTEIANGSNDAIARVAAGKADIALADLNALIRTHDGAAAALKAVFVVFNAAPYAILARKSRGIRSLVDLKGKTLGVAEGDLAIRLWPALAERNGIDPASVKQQHISAAVREPMLSAGQVDAVTGFSYLSAVNLRDRGVPADDLAVLRFADYGGEAYGAAIIVNPTFAARQPEAVHAFLNAVIAGMRFAINTPAEAIDAVMTRMNGGSRDLELARLRSAIRNNIITPDVKRDGFGAVDPARLARAIRQVAADFKFRKTPQPADVFDDAFLPPSDARMLTQ